MITEERLLTRDGTLLYLRRGNPLGEPNHSSNHHAEARGLDEILWLLPGDHITSAPAAASYELLKSSVPWLQHLHARLHTPHGDRSVVTCRGVRFEMTIGADESLRKECLEALLHSFTRHILHVRDALQLDTPHVSPQVNWNDTGTCVDKSGTCQLQLPTRRGCQRLVVELRPAAPRYRFPIRIYSGGAR